MLVKIILYKIKINMFVIYFLVCKIYDENNIKKIKPSIAIYPVFVYNFKYLNFRYLLFFKNNLNKFFFKNNNNILSYAKKKQFLIPLNFKKKFQFNFNLVKKKKYVFKFIKLNCFRTEIKFNINFNFILLFQTPFKKVLKTVNYSVVLDLLFYNRFFNFKIKKYYFINKTNQIKFIFYYNSNINFIFLLQLFLIIKVNTPQFIFKSTLSTFSKSSFNTIYFNFYYSYNFLFHFNNFHPFLNQKDLDGILLLLLKKKKTSLVIFNIFNLNFLEYFLKQKFFIKIRNNLYKKLLFKKIKNIILSRFKRKRLNIKFFFNISELINLLVYSFYKKDLYFIFNFFIRVLEKIHIAYHKQFLMFFKNLILDHFFIYFSYFSIKGFFFDIRGKVGVTGNSKKRHFCFTAGSLKYSSKMVKLEYKNDIVKTVTGCLGVTMFLSYY